MEGDGIPAGPRWAKEGRSGTEKQGALFQQQETCAEQPLHVAASPPGLLWPLQGAPALNSLVFLESAPVLSKILCEDLNRQEYHKALQCLSSDLEPGSPGVRHCVIGFCVF